MEEKAILYDPVQLDLLLRTRKKRRAKTIGSNFEREVVKTLEEKDFLAFRCAGSRGKHGVDVVGIKKDYIWLVQCKLSGEITKMKEKVLKENAKKYGCIAFLAKKGESGEVIFSKDRTVFSCFAVFRFSNPPQPTHITCCCGI